MGFECVSDQIGDSRGAISHSDLFEVVFGGFLPKDDLHLAEISLLSEASAPGGVPHASVPFGEADEAAVHPKSEWIEALSFGVVDQVVKCPDHHLCHFAVASFEAVDGIQYVSFLEEHECVFRPGSDSYYFFIEVMIHFRSAEIVTLGISSMGFGYSTQKWSLV